MPEMAKTLGKEWKELDEEGRKPFVARAEKDHARYQAEMKDYKPPEKVLKMGDLPLKAQVERALCCNPLI